MDQEASDIVALSYLHLLKVLILADRMGWQALLPHGQKTVWALKAILIILEVEFD